MSERRRRAPALALGFALLCVAGGAPASGAPVAGAEGAALRAVVASARAEPGQLELVERIAAPGGGAIHRYVQRLGDLRVLGAEAVVADPATGPPQLVVDHSVAGLDPRRSSAAISRRAAIGRAGAAAEVERLRARARAGLGIDRETGAVAWEVRLPAAVPLADLLVSVDARTGAVLRSRDLLRRATGSAALFDPNPVATQGSYTGLRDDKDRDSAALDAQRVSVALERLQGTKGCLIGAYVDARLGRKAKPVCEPSLSFDAVGRADNRFEALMAYFHIDRTRAYIDSLALSEGLRSKPQKVRANGIAEDNSYYSPFQRSITLGTGGVDDGEDADVIVHEYGHSIQDQQVRFFGESLQGAALGEGFGDYIAATMSSQVASGDPVFDPCMFEWDAVSYTKHRCARRTDKAITKTTANRRCQREPHCVGEAWAGALWELRAELGGDAAAQSVIDRVVLESHFLLARRSGFRDAASALLAADDLLYAGAHRAEIEAEMIERRFCAAGGCE